jgi:hypothetical protein
VKSFDEKIDPQKGKEYEKEAQYHHVCRLPSSPADGKSVMN